jgi:hypothetical protein
VARSWLSRSYKYYQKALQHWQDPEERKDRRFFFCQLEAIETLIWLTEAPEAEKIGIEIPSDGGEFSRWCNKMATGTGKTIVMSMLIAWNVLNKVANGKDTRFSKKCFNRCTGLNGSQSSFGSQSNRPTKLLRGVQHSAFGFNGRFTTRENKNHQLACFGLANRRKDCQEKIG